MICSSQSFKIYQILNRNFKSETDSKELVQEIAAAIENRFHSERDRLATKEDLARLETNLILWLVGYNTALAGIILAGIKFLFYEVNISSFTTHSAQKARNFSNIDFRRLWLSQSLCLKQNE